MSQAKSFVPVNSYEEAQKLIPLGADEIYLGFIEKRWIKHFHLMNLSVLSCNRRESMKYNYTNIKEVQKTVDFSHKNNVQVHITLNAHFYPDFPEYYAELMGRLKSIQPDYLVLSDLYMIHMVRKELPRIKINLSGDSLVINDAAVAFYKKLGITRITLPQSMSQEEIKQICHNNPDVKFELFLFNARCLFNSGTCFSLHNFPNFRGSIIPPVCSAIENRLCKHQEPGSLQTIRANQLACGMCGYLELRSIKNLVAFKDIATGLILSYQTVVDFARWNPHWHGLLLEGGFDEKGNFVLLPISDTKQMTELFRRKVIKLFEDKKLINQDFAKNLLSWKNSGFSIDNSTLEIV